MAFCDQRRWGLPIGFAWRHALRWLVDRRYVARVGDQVLVSPDQPIPAR